MDLSQITAQMANNAATIQSFTRGVSNEQARWKPDADSWSILEVINHLYDEEREDFRLHLDAILNQPDIPWKSFDPQGWVSQRRYNERDLEQSIGNFLREREQSLAWLKGLSAANWQSVNKFGSWQITAGDMLASWAAHDLLHIRQLVELHWAYTVRAMQPYEVGYAGDW